MAYTIKKKKLTRTSHTFGQYGGYHEYTEEKYLLYKKNKLLGLFNYKKDVKSAKNKLESGKYFYFPNAITLQPSIIRKVWKR